MLCVVMANQMSTSPTMNMFNEGLQLQLKHFYKLNEQIEYRNFCNMFHTNFLLNHVVSREMFRCCYL